MKTFELGCSGLEAMLMSSIAVAVIRFWQVASIANIDMLVLDCLT